MRVRPLLLSLSFSLGSGLLLSIAFGHGGTYRGPGDTVPAGGGGNPTGGTGGAPTPGGGGPPTGGPTGAPTGGAPTGGGGTGGTPPARPQGGTPTGGPPAVDLTNWEFWWNFNKDQFLGLRSAIYSGPETGWSGDDHGRRNALIPSQSEIREKIVPGLELALETERQNDIVTAALVALAKIGDVRDEDGRSAFVERFKTWLPDHTQEVAETAGVAFGILANDSCVRLLIDIANDSEMGRKLVGQGTVPIRTRAFATYGLGLIGARTASNAVRGEIVDALVALLGSSEKATRDVQVAAVISLGLTPIDWNPSSAFEGRSGAASSRGAQIQFLQGLFRNESGERLARAHVPGALAHLLTRERDLPAEGRALREAVLGSFSERIGEHTSEREEVQQSCVLALGQLVDLDDDAADARARADLGRIADHGQTQSRAFALIALGQIGGHPGDGNGSAESLNGIRGLLVEKLTGGSTSLRPWAALGLGICEREIEELGSAAFPLSAEVRSTMRSAFRTASQETVGAYAIALGIARDTESAALLQGRLMDISESGQQGYTALALGMIGAVDAKARIQGLIRSSKYKAELLRQAAIALGLLGDKTLVPELVTMLAESKSLASQAAVASALGFIGDARSIDPLLAMLKNKQLTGTARGFAAVALGIVADKESLPWNAKISTNINYRANTSTLTTPEGTGLLDIL